VLVTGHWRVWVMRLRICADGSRDTHDLSRFWSNGRLKISSNRMLNLARRERQQYRYHR
jgi:hypothetical protein